MEEISQEKEPKNNHKNNQSEDIHLFSSKNNDSINIENNQDNPDITPSKTISYTFDHNKYKRTRLFGINFYHIGNLYVFGFFNFNSEPLFCIDNGWYFQIIIYLVEILIYYLGNRFLYSKIEYWKQLIFNGLLILFFFVYTALIFINPGIIIKSEKPKDKNSHFIFCKKCKLYVSMERNTEHCYDCNVCVRKLDHHCSVVRRCITNRNFWLFVGMIAIFMLIYVFSLVLLILYLVGSYKKMKKK